jgi:hypothetical protein
MDTFHLCSPYFLEEADFLLLELLSPFSREEALLQSQFFELEDSPADFADIFSVDFMFNLLSYNCFNCFF